MLHSVEEIVEGMVGEVVEGDGGEKGSTLTSPLFTPRRFEIQWCFLGDLFWVWLRFFQNLLPGFRGERGGVLLPDWGPFVSWVGGALVLGSGGEGGAEQGDG